MRLQQRTDESVSHTPVAAAQDGQPGVADGARHVYGINNVLQLNSHVCCVAGQELVKCGCVVSGKKDNTSTKQVDKFC